MFIFYPTGDEIRSEFLIYIVDFSSVFVTFAFLAVSSSARYAADRLLTPDAFSLAPVVRNVPHHSLASLERGGLGHLGRLRLLGHLGQVRLLCPSRLRCPRPRSPLPHRPCIAQSAICRTDRFSVSCPKGTPGRRGLCPSPTCDNT